MDTSRNRRPGARACIGLLLALLLLAFDAAALRRIEPGEQPDLAPGEGLLAVAFDTDVPVLSARFRKSGTVFTAGVLTRLHPGRTIELYAVPAGRYQWAYINFAESWYWRSFFDLSEDDEYSFEVKPGRINYAGDLVFRPRSLKRSLIHIANRSLPILDWLDAQHPALVARHEFVYSGHFPDPFPAFYRQALASAAHVPADPNAGRAPPEAGAMAIPPERMWAAPRVRDMAMSPDGALVAVELREGEDEYAIDLVDVAAGHSQRVFESRFGFGTIVWESERILLVGAPRSDGETLNALRIGEPHDGVRKVVRLKGPTGGSIVDLLPESPARLLYQARDQRGQLVVHELGIEDQRAFESFRRSQTRDRLNTGVNDDLGWYADGHGRLRAALARRGDDTVLMYGQGSEFREVLRYTGDDGFTPVRLSYDGDLIYGLSDRDRAQRDLVVFDPARGEVTRTLYSQPGVDVFAPLFDDRRNPIGVSYYEDGRLLSHYFDDADSRVAADLRQAFPSLAVTPVQRSRDGRKRLLWIDGSDHPPLLYYFDADRRHAQLLEPYFPQFDGHRFVPAQRLEARGSDGLLIEAFLTLPPAAGKRPLVVMPHGGPIGVADRLHFDREVQSLAALGYAVLQVNFRGSEGFGRAFREAGHRQFGTGIEDDIDAALRSALQRFPLDESRMCMLGTSYGGYSALVSAIRWPGRFRCVVSIAGVSDRLLAFTASDSARSAPGREQLIELMGDPRDDRDALMQASPLYQYRSLTVPLMLIHGREDLRVDFEHTRRLVRLLNIDGRTPVVQAFPDEGHGLTDPKALGLAWTGIAGFLQQHLGPAEGVTAAVPAAASQQQAGDGGQLESAGHARE